MLGVVEVERQCGGVRGGGPWCLAVGIERLRRGKMVAVVWFWFYGWLMRWMAKDLATAGVVSGNFWLQVDAADGGGFG